MKLKVKYISIFFYIYIKMSYMILKMYSHINEKICMIPMVCVRSKYIIRYLSVVDKYFV